MNRFYQRVTRVCGWTAAGAAGLYILALLLAASDGTHRGIEVRIEVSGLALVVISLLGIVASVGWLIDQANKVLAERVADAVSEAVIRELDPRIQRAAKHASSRTVKLLNESITGELMTDQLNAAVNRAYRYGQLANVGSAVEMAEANGQPWPTHPGVEATNGSVSAMRRR